MGRKRDWLTIGKENHYQSFSAIFAAGGNFPAHRYEGQRETAARYQPGDQFHDGFQYTTGVFFRRRGVEKDDPLILEDARGGGEAYDERFDQSRVCRKYRTSDSKAA